VVKSEDKQRDLGVAVDGWRDCDIADLCTLQRGFDLTEATRRPGSIPVYSSSGLSYFHDEAKLQPPAVITGRKGLLGRVFLVDEPCWPHDTTLWVRDFKGNDPRYVSLFLSEFRLERFDAATSVPTLNRNNLVGHPIRIPPLAEQRLIAAVLSDVEALLDGLDRLIVKKGDLKQGAAQQLLTGQTRLPGFRGEWETKPLEAVAHIKTGSRNNEDKVPGGQYPFFVRSEIVERINTYSHECEAILVPGEGRIGDIFHYIDGRFDVISVSTPSPSSRRAVLRSLSTSTWHFVSGLGQCRIA
jgi:type I restriction enzyme S subunit